MPARRNLREPLFSYLQYMQNKNVQPATHALIIGATGATGKDLLQLLLNDETFHRVDVFVRRPLEMQHRKLSVHVIDFDSPAQWKHLVQGDVLFSCLGTTLKAAGSKEAQRKIDYDYQYNFAQAARENNVHSYVLVSAGLASPNSSFFYSRMKGELEVAVKKLAFPKLLIFNPPLLIRKNSDRFGEVAGLKLIKFLNRLGLFRSQKPLPTELLAQAMVTAVKTAGDGVAAFKAQDIWRLAGNENS